MERRPQTPDRKRLGTGAAALFLLIIIWAAGGSAAAGTAGPVLASPGRAALGQPFLVRLTSDQAMEGIAMFWMGKRLSPSVSVWNQRYVGLAMLGTDVLTDRPGPADLEVSARINGREIRLRRTIDIVPKSYPRQDLTLPPQMVTPPASVLERIKEERGLTTAAKETLTPMRYWTLPFFRPVPGKITSLYGLQRYLNGKPKNPHRGLDFRAPAGTPIRAVASGRAVLSGDHYYAGNSLYIDHGNGVVSMYFHMSRIAVEAGARIKRGQVIGFSGATGRSTGAHLHLSVSVRGRLVDPLPLITDTADQLLSGS